MAKQLGCAGLPDLLDLLEQNKDSKHIYILFCGESDDTGESWCPDCVKGTYSSLINRSLRLGLLSTIDLD